MKTVRFYRKTNRCEYFKNIFTSLEQLQLRTNLVVDETKNKNLRDFYHPAEKWKKCNERYWRPEVNWKRESSSQSSVWQTCPRLKIFVWQLLHFFKKYKCLYFSASLKFKYWMMTEFSRTKYCRKNWTSYVRCFKTNSQKKAL